MWINWIVRWELYDLRTIIKSLVSLNNFPNREGVKREDEEDF